MLADEALATQRDLNAGSAPDRSPITYAIEVGRDAVGVAPDLPVLRSHGYHPGRPGQERGLVPSGSPWLISGRFFPPVNVGRSQAPEGLHSRPVSHNAHEFTTLVPRAVNVPVWVMNLCYRRYWGSRDPV